MAVVPRCTCRRCTAAPPDPDPPIWLAVVHDLAARDAVGRAEYGDSLRASTGVDLLRYAYEEALDLAVYLRGELERQKEG